MKPSSDKPEQIADIHAVRRRSGDRVPMRMKGWELSTETSRSLLKVDFHNTSLPEDITDHRLSESKLCSSLEMDLADQECDSFERIASGIVEQTIHLGSPPGIRWQKKRHITEDDHISLFECSLPEIDKFANSINEPPISISYEGTSRPDHSFQESGIYYHTYDPDPPDKSISHGTTSCEDGITYRYSTSEPPGSTVRSLAIANTSPPGSTSYSLSEGLFGAHMQGVQGKVDTSTKSVSLGMRGVRNGKHSLSDYHPYPVTAEHSYSPPGIIFHDQTVRTQHL